jgi:mRNA deadenylase 3'-5' endonuclease subunit Ccr4
MEADLCYETQLPTLKLRVATYNILNTSDRYDEGRERLLKQNLYQLNADIIGMQEVAFGSKQLDELVIPTREISSS